MTGAIIARAAPSTSLPGAPTGLLLGLQGQTSPASTSSPPTPPHPNIANLSWNAVVGATSYNIYRGLPGGNLTLLATGITGTTYDDTVATLTVSGTAGPGPEYYIANHYQWRVTAVNSSGEGPQSQTQSCIYYANGVQAHTGGDFNTGCTTVYNSTLPVSHPTDTLGAKCTMTSGFGIWLPWSGNQAVEWNLPVGAYDFIEIDVLAMQSGSTLQFLCHRVGDVVIQNSVGGQLTAQSTTYGTLTANTWVTLRIPLSALLLDWTSGSPTLQRSFYKINVQTNSGSGGEVFYFTQFKFVPQSAVPFDFFIGPNGDDNNPGTLASPWSITALGTLPNRATAACKWTTYSPSGVGKRVGLLPGTYTQGQSNGIVTTLYSLAMSPDAFGPGCTLLVNGGTPGAPVTIGACNSAGYAFSAPYSAPTAIIDTTNSGTPPQYAATLLGQTTDGTDGVNEVPHYGNIILDGIQFNGFCASGVTIGDNAHTNTPGVVIRNCRFSNGAGFHDSNHNGFSVSNCVGAIIQNCWIHDIMTVANTFTTQFTASFSGTSMIVSAITFGSLAPFGSETQFVYGPGLPTNLSIIGGPGGGTGTYTLSASVGTIGSQTCSVGSTGSVVKWGGYGMCNFNGGSTPTVIENCTFERVGIVANKTNQQAMNMSYCYVELGNFGSFTGVSGAGSFGNTFFSTPLGASSIVDHCIFVGGELNPSTDGSGGSTNNGSLQLSNLTFYQSTSQASAAGCLGTNNGASPAETTLLNSLFWADGPGYPGFEGGLNLIGAPTAFTNNNNAFINSANLFSYGTSAPGSTPQSLAAWQTSTGLEANSVSLPATPFASTPFSGTPSSFDLNGTTPALTAGVGGVKCGAMDGTLSSLGLSPGCSFAT